MTDTPNAEYCQIEKQRLARDLVASDVHGNVSSLIADLAKLPEGEHYDEALSLSMPQPDYVATVEEAGELEDWEDALELLNREASGFFVDTAILGAERIAEARDEDKGRDADDIRRLEARRYVVDHCRENPDDAEKVCDELRLELVENEVYEHWVVSRWLKQRLAEKGEVVGELYGLSVWGRCCTGQSIALDCVFQDIAVELENVRGGRDQK
ncbi:hypothetical protein SAMN05444156_2184 [Verrucomicrobium sp. GAS474]|uniref:hypothetical protein n=1 Tax=Verrucomicrobium sp. GAS474 TaxID=1882831 RepID=UPI00087AA93D|nr:hypothetical protein [Verrucomicrobium sp. GAS474]SDU13786.1 hypothetical protein SAMN05444156_2184 [Verrucomicrobium sp. GAS474]